MNDEHLGQLLQPLHLLPQQAITVTGNGGGIDIRDYVGELAVVLTAKNVAGTTPTLDVKLQDSDDDSTYADVTGAVFAQVTDAGTLAATVEKIAVRADTLKRYIRAVKTIGGTSSPQFIAGCVALGVKQVR